MTDEKQIPVPEELEDILLEFTINVLVEKPADIISHAATYFTRLKNERAGITSTKGGSTDNLPQNAAMHSISKMLGTRAMRRPTVFAEAFDPEGDDKADIETYPKSKEETKRIRDRIKDIFLFQHLNDKDLEAVIEAMRPTQVKEGQIIIRQGEEGDFFYVIDKGTFGTYITQDDGQEKYVKTYKNSGCFGELALLHNQPRAATIKAATDGMLWAVSRSSFSKLIIKNAHEKRKKYMELLDKVTELQPLTDYEKMQVCDALTSVTLKEGELLFKEGDEGNGMYFVEEGMIGIHKKSKSGEEELAKLKAGDYFGELAIVKKQPRAGTARALENTELAFLDVEAFERLLGPCLDIMKKRMEAYKKSKK